MILDRAAAVRPGGGAAAGAVAAIAGVSAAGTGEDRAMTGPRWCASGARRPSAREAQAAAREIEHLLAAGEVPPEAVCVIVGSGWREARLVAAALEERSGSLPVRGRRGALPAPRGSRRARLAADAGRPHRLGRGRPGAHPPAGRAALDRPGSLHRHRPTAQARHDLGARGRPREPPAAAGGARPDQGLPQAPALGFRGDGGDAGRRLRSPPHRAHRPAAPPAVRRDARGRGAAPEPLPPLRARRRVDPARAPRLGSRLRPAPHRGRRRRASSSPTMPRPPRAARSVLAEPEQVKGLEFEHVYVLGLHRGAIAARDSAAGWLPRSLLAERALSRGRGRDGAAGPASPTWR